MNHQVLRRKTRQVMVGNVGIGADHPIRIQSMTTTNTRDVRATIEQICQLADKGCEIVRVTVQGKKEAESCEAIKSGLIQRGYLVPLVADIHFYPPAALYVADFVEKIRMNPGNFADKRASFQKIEYDEVSYRSELEKIEEKFAPLVQKCKALKRALRIGVNHGSLSDRIMNRYGDTPRGMVESALEYACLCHKWEYHDLIFSMKASNPLVMIEAYRLLVKEFDNLGWNYPLHLGVTEAGEGEDGRVKSAVGIGALLLEGIGDTIRVSLTESPIKEINPCRRLVNATEGKKSLLRHHRPPPNGKNDYVVLTVTQKEVEAPDFFEQIGCKIQLGQLQKDFGTVDAVIARFKHPKLDKLVKAGIKVISDPYIIGENGWEQIIYDQPDWIFFSPLSDYLYHAHQFFEWLYAFNVQIPVILQFDYTCVEQDLVMRASANLGALFCEGVGEGLCLQAPFPLNRLRFLSLAILQATRRRLSKTDFISCPGCGRTLFDLQKVSEKIRNKTAHLPGVKIAVMGCIVNGPGEMADADFGYVGSKPGKIDLYVGKTCVEKDVDMNVADDRLIALIKKEGLWVDSIS